MSGDDHFIRPDNDLPDEHENEGWLFLMPVIRAVVARLEVRA